MDTPRHPTLPHMKLAAYGCSLAAAAANKNTEKANRT